MGSPPLTKGRVRVGFTIPHPRAFLSHPQCQNLMDPGLIPTCWEPESIAF